MEKEKIPTLEPRKGCSHKNSDPLYARGEKSWTSTQKINGTMTYVCYDCGSFFRKANEDIKIDANCEENVGGSNE